jgi:23S rRNA (adenine2503-C2)-methyltransferase
VAAWLWQKGVTAFTAMSDLPLEVRALLAARAAVRLPGILAKHADPSGDAVKYLLGLADGHAVEAVLLRYRYGLTLCLSTQVGCRMGCLFCASAAAGWVRHLTAGEMAGQVLTVRRDAGEEIRRLVLMGIGEPLDNYEATRRFLLMATSPRGLAISPRRITVSTCGLVPRIYDLAREGPRVTLAVSLHAPDDRLRDLLVPVNRRYPLRELIAACRAYAATTGRRVTFAYALAAGVNDSPAQARRLAALIRGTLCQVNLIPLNRVEGKDFVPPTPGRVATFRRILEQEGVSVTVRRRLGTPVNAACGQLRRKWDVGKGRWAGAVECGNASGMPAAE